MRAWERRLVGLSNLLVGGTGLVYGWMRYLLEPAEPWDVVNHPWQPQLQHLHVLFAPLLVFACGLIWREHVASRSLLRPGPGRRSGLLLVVGLVPMVFSGAAIQIATGPLERKVWVAVHLVASCLWMIATLAHRWRSPTLLGSGLRTQHRAAPVDPSRPPERAVP